jgi:hypothetical protein
MMNQGQGRQATISKLIGLRYYDGPIGGLVLLNLDGSERLFWFELLSWDSLQDNRVFALSEIADGGPVLDRVIRAISVLGAPKWPIWVPSWNFETEEARKEADAVIAEIVSSRAPYSVVMCAPDDLSVVRIHTDLGPVHFSQLNIFNESGLQQAFEDWQALCWPS